RRAGPIQDDGRRPALPLHAVRGRRGAHRVPVLGRARVQVPLPDDRHRARVADGRVEHLGRVRYGGRGPAHDRLQEDASDAVVPAGGGGRAAGVRARSRHFRAHAGGDGQGRQRPGGGGRGRAARGGGRGGGGG